jgi:hypothetical protein
MPIDPIVVQRRHAEQGRIRLGAKVPVGNQGKSRPSKLEQFRFTSPNERLIKDLAQLYGGEPRAWDNNGLSEWEVFSDATSIPVVVVKGGVSQWMELWSGGGIAHRCDGVRDAKTGEPCNPDDPQHQNARPTTRLSVILPELDSIGTWRLETHGWNAAAEIPMIAELAAYVGSMVPATLHLVERRQVSNGETKRFVVPVVDLEIGTRELVALVGGGGKPAEIEAPKQQEIAAGPDPDEILAGYQDQIDACQTTEEVSTLWRAIVAQGHLWPNVKEALVARGRELAPVTPDEAPASSTAQDGPEEQAIEGEILPDPVEDDRAWQDVLSAAGKQGLATMEVLAEFESWAGHPVDQGNAEEYRRFITEGLS